MSQDNEDRTDPPGAGDDGTGQPAGSGDNGREPNDADRDHLTAELREARQDAGKYRRQLREVQRELEALRADADKGKGEQDDDTRAKELEDARREREQLSTRLRRVSLRAAVAANAPSLKLIDVDAALALLPADDVEWDGDEPTEDSVKDALAALLDAKPFLRATDEPGRAPAGTGRTGGSGGQDPPKQTDAERRARLYAGGKTSIWDAEAAKLRGGGVVGT